MTNGKIDPVLDQIDASISTRIPGYDSKNFGRRGTTHSRPKDWSDR